MHSYFSNRASYPAGPSATDQLPHVVIAGAGFGGIQAAKILGKAAGARAVRVTVLDRQNFHLFQPLLYQVATAALSPAQIATPIRSIFRRQVNIEVRLAELERVDVASRKILLREVGMVLGQGRVEELPYDYLVLAMGATHSYFGHDDWERFAPSLKTVTDATRIRAQVLSAFEEAEIEPDPLRRQELLRFVIVGGGPTGVELAGSIAELAHRTLRTEFRHIDPSSTEILLIEAGPRVLPHFPFGLSEFAERTLVRMGVKVLKDSRVAKIDDDGVLLGGRHIASRVVLWAAGVKASPVGQILGSATDRSGRVFVRPDLTLPEDPHVFVIGDMAHFEQDGIPLPGVAPVAMQMGRYVGRVILERECGRVSSVKPFRYWDKGNLATIGRHSGVASFGRLRLRGAVAWLAWVGVHIFYLIGFRNRLVVLIEWAWLYLTFKRGARLITPTEAFGAEPAAEEAGRKVA